uniref:Ig-like domain-containing protein n=1 Tax=Meleagris gallopavo TaxID=9103 RepID=A0A803YF87_MELGA
MVTAGWTCWGPCVTSHVGQNIGAMSCVWHPMGDNVQGHELAELLGRCVTPSDDKLQRTNQQGLLAQLHVCHITGGPKVLLPIWAVIATSGGDITPSCPKRGTDSSSMPLPFPTAVLLSPSCCSLMAPMALALIVGWWLVAASRAQQLPRPSLSLHPSQGVSLGDTVTLRCHLPRPAARVDLYKEGYSGF